MPHDRGTIVRATDAAPAGMPLTGAPAAAALLDRLSLVKTSPSALHWLRLAPDTLRATELGGALLRLCDELDVDVPALGGDFFRAVRAAAAACPTVAPDVFAVASKKKQCIAEFYAMVEKERRASADKFHLLGALMPFCYQLMRDKVGHVKKVEADGNVVWVPKTFKCCLFFMHAAPEDGVAAIRDGLAAGSRWTDLDGLEQVFPEVIEHRYGARTGSPDAVDNRLSYLIVDWEAYRSKAGGRLSDAELRQRMREFPLWFYRRLLDLDYVAPAACVTAVFKNKSREVVDRQGAPDYKFSAHFVFSVAAVASTTLAHACERVFAPCQDRIDACKHDYSDLSDADLAEPWFAADTGTMGGNTGFSTLGSRKAVSNPQATIEGRFVFHGGEQARFVPYPSASFVYDGPRALPPEEVARALLASLYTYPRFDTQRLTAKAEKESETRQNRAAAKRRQAVSGAGPPLASRRRGEDLGRNLPAWVSSEIQAGCATSSTAGKKFMLSLVDYVKDIETWESLHVGTGGFYCPAALCKPLPVKWRHRKNGVVIVYKPGSDECVYVGCCKCYHGDEFYPGAEVQITTRDKNRWVRLTEASLKALLGAAKEPFG